MMQARYYIFNFLLTVGLWNAAYANPPHMVNGNYSMPPMPPQQAPHPQYQQQYQQQYPPSSHHPQQQPYNQQQPMAMPEPVVVQPPPKLVGYRPPSVMEQALTLHRAGRFAEAVHLYESIIYSTAPDPRLYASIADAHLRLNNNERALKYTVESLKLDPYYASGHLLLGTILGEMGDYTRAVRSYKKVLVLDQNNPFAYYNLGLLHYKKSDVKSAIQYLEKARELNPKDAKIWNNLGVVYYDQGMYLEALTAFSEALNLAPQYRSAQQNILLVQQQRPDLPMPPIIRGDDADVLPKDITTKSESDKKKK